VLANQRAGETSMSVKSAEGIGGECCVDCHAAMCKTVGHFPAARCLVKQAGKTFFVPRKRKNFRWLATPGRALASRFLYPVPIRDAAPAAKNIFSPPIPCDWGIDLLKKVIPRSS
jgi:hypothetical protein